MRSLRKILSLALTASLLFQQIGFAQIAAELNISGHLSRMASSLAIDKFRPLHLRYFSYDLNSDNFKFLFDKGDSEKGLSPKGTVPFPEESQELLKYFLIGISLPDSKFWVNLRPDSSDRIIEPELEQTDLGRVLLEADLQLKKDTARYTSPETPEGREYWNKLYKKAEELFGLENVTIPTLTRPWIVPGEIIVRETQESAFIYKSTLKVMLEQDYLEVAKSQSLKVTSEMYTFKDERSKVLNEYSTQLIKELIIPKLTKEVNTSKKYANLRQAFYSLILSRWFKARFQGLSNVIASPEGAKQSQQRTPFYVNLINSGNLTGLTSKESWSKSTYFKAYQKSFTDGEYNIKEPVYTPTGQVIRSYFSGGFAMIDPATVYKGVGAKAIGDEKFLTSNKNFAAVTFTKTGPSDGAVLAPIISLQGEIEKVQKPSSSSPITIEALKRELITRGLNLELTNKLLKAVKKPFLLGQNAFTVSVGESRFRFFSLNVSERTSSWPYNIITFEGSKGESLFIHIPVSGKMDRIEISTTKFDINALTSVSDTVVNIMKALNSAAGSPLDSKKHWLGEDNYEPIGKNEGEFTARNVEIRDGKNRTIPITSALIDFIKQELENTKKKHGVTGQVTLNKVGGVAMGLTLKVGTLSADKSIDFKEIVEKILNAATKKAEELSAGLPIDAELKGKIAYFADTLADIAKSGKVVFSLGEPAMRIISPGNERLAGLIQDVGFASVRVGVNLGFRRNNPGKLIIIEIPQLTPADIIEERLLRETGAAGSPITGKELITAIENAFITYPKDRQSAYDSLDQVKNLPEKRDRVAAKMKELTDLYGFVGVVLDKLKKEISPEQSFISVEDFLQKQALDNLLDGVDGKRVLAMVANLLKNELDVLQIELSRENKLSSSAVTKNDITEKEKQVANARRQAYNPNQAELDRAYALGKLPRLNRELADLQKKKRLVSSPMTPDGINTKKDVGGIDFRVMNIITQPLVASSSLNLKLPQSANLAKINLDEELMQMKNMLSARIIPSGERIKEFMASSALKGEWDRRIPEIISYLVDVCRLEEDNVSETPVAIREALIIADSVRRI